MSDVLLIIVAGLLVYLFGKPFVESFEEWKKVMEAEEGEEDV